MTETSAEAPRHPHHRTGLREIFPALSLLIFGLFGIMLMTLFSEDDSGKFMIVAPLGSTALQTFHMAAASGGALIGAGRLENVIFAASDDENFVKTLYAAGAWLVLPAPKYLGCETAGMETSA